MLLKCCASWLPTGKAFVDSHEVASGYRIAFYMNSIHNKMFVLPAAVTGKHRENFGSDASNGVSRI